jgi:DNA-binding HxlR family transcriptional regulator
MKAWEKPWFLSTIKVLADESRLNIIWLLNEREYNVGDLAQQLELTEPTVSHHLSKLHGAGLLNLRMDGTRRFYRLNNPRLDQFKQMVARMEAFEAEPETNHHDYAWIDALGWDEEDAQILRDQTVNGKLPRIPSKLRKTRVILRWVATLFEPDRLYTEKEVNEVIKTVHSADYATLRRELVDFGWLRRERDGGKYWLAPEKEAVPKSSE